ncbi:hypothetical protein INT45_007323 [Circinella minor]|uniref:Fungal lipase-type domain-containing protein n=1 Tax=Circinella minor TaxID=1195481 RepID=A0A8H7RYC3_9FUNG|nr:hypothetical protein INT45_007323 [Circinella minor]
MTQTRALPIQNNNSPSTPIPKSPCSLDSMTKRSNSPSRFKRSMKGVRNLFRHFDPDKEFNQSNMMSSINVNNGSVNSNNSSNNNDQQLQSDNHSYGTTHQKIAMTLSENVNIPDQDDNNIDLIETKGHYSQYIQFLPIHQHQYHYNNNNNISHNSNKSNTNNTIKAYVHYEPSRKLVALGNNPDTKHTKTVWLTLEQYAWIIRQLHHEQYIYGLLRNMSSNSSPLSIPTTVTSWSTSSSYLQHKQQAVNDPQITTFIGILLNNNDTNNKINGSDSREQIIHNNKNHRNSIQSSTQTFNTITRRLSRLMQRAKLNRYQHHHQTLLLLPKSLLLHAAFYIPMTKPLPPLLHPTTFTTKNDHDQQQLESPFHSIPNTLSVRLHRYVQLAALCMHDLSLDDSSGSLLCRKCYFSNPVIRQLKSIIPTNTHSDISSSSILSPTTTTTMKQHQHQPMIQVTPMTTTTTTTRNNDATFPITYLHTSIEQRRRTFDSHYSSSSFLSPNNTIPSLSSTNIMSLNSKRTTTHSSQQQVQEEQQQHYKPRACSAIITDSAIDPLFDSSLLDSVMGKRGYVAMDDENQEIIVTFPGIPASGLLFENTSFTPVPWRESLDSNQQQRQGQKYYQQQEGHLRDNDNDEDEPYVLECAVAAWRRCELTVATSLMRICRIAPEDYRVVIIGHSLGGAVAAICASSLVTTGLLVDRSVTLCTIDSPRVGSASFVEHLAEHIETIRITHVSDIWSQMPPRTSGLLHVGSTTITVLNNNNHNKYAEDQEQGEQEKKEETIHNDNDKIIHDTTTATAIDTIKDEDVCMLQANDSIWIENYLADTFPSSISSYSSYSSIWGISLYSTPCQQQSQLTHYDEKHLCIV